MWWIVVALSFATLEATVVKKGKAPLKLLKMKSPGEGIYHAFSYAEYLVPKGKRDYGAQTRYDFGRRGVTIECIPDDKCQCTMKYDTKTITDFTEKSDYCIRKGDTIRCLCLKDPSVHLPLWRNEEGECRVRFLHTTGHQDYSCAVQPPRPVSTTNGYMALLPKDAPLLLDDIDSLLEKSSDKLHA